MPWKPSDALRHTKKATTPIAKRQFADVANNVLRETGDEGRAVREANAEVGKREAIEDEPSSKQHGMEPMHPHDPYAKRK